MYKCKHTICPQLFTGQKNLININESFLQGSKIYDYSFSDMFVNCYNLKNTPKLPQVDQLYPYCYKSMFYGCSSLVETPDFPTLNLAKFCYAYMFKNCINLKKIKALNANIMYESCYDQMFARTGIEDPPELPAMVLAKSCYHYMFGEHRMLKSYPKLPATILADSCYQAMFWTQFDSSTADTTPELLAKTLKYLCYSDMFRQNNSLRNINKISAETYCLHACRNFTTSCSNITNINAQFIELEDGSSLITDEFISSNLSNHTGTYIKNKYTKLTNQELCIPDNWTVIEE